MADNSDLFKQRKRPSQPPYKRVEVSTVATTIGVYDALDRVVYHAVVLVRQQGLRTYEALRFESFDTRLEALQRAHYINANMIMRTGDPLPKHGTGGNGKTLAVFKEEGYQL